MDGIYTLRFTCPRCGERTWVAHPPPFSPDDRFARYRRKIIPSA